MTREAAEQIVNRFSAFIPIGTIDVFYGRESKG